MNLSPTNLALVVAGIIFVLTFLIVLLSTSRTTKMKWIQADKGSGLKNKKIKFIEEARKAGVNVTNDQYMLYWLVAAIISAGLAFALSNPFVFLVGMMFFWFLLQIIVTSIEQKKLQQARNKFGQALQNVASSYRIHQNWLKVLQEVIVTLEDPLLKEFQRVYQAHSSGQPIGDCFRELGNRLKIEKDLALFVTMVELSQVSGGKYVAEGIMTAGRDFQAQRVLSQSRANAMMAAATDNRNLFFGFVGTILYFRFFQKDIFLGYMNSLLGNILLAFFIGNGILLLYLSYKVLKKEV